MTPSLTFGSLFAGIGGFDLGFERAGMVCRWQVEKDASCRRVLRDRFPGPGVSDDVRHAGSDSLPPVDVICGGFPCQDLSVAGKQVGIAEGTRSGLFFEMVRIVDELRPALLVWENVPGLLTNRRGRDMLAVLTALDRVGYGGGWTVVDARHFGLAQRRRRVFGVFARGDIGAARCAEILSLRDRLPGRAAEDGAAKVREARSGHPRGPGRHHPAGGRVAKCLTTSVRYNAEENHIVQPVAFNWNQAGDTAMGMSLPGVPPARANDGLAVCHAGSVRRLTPVEYLRLQGFPDSWLDLTPPLADRAKYRMAGNAVAVPCAEWIARGIVRTADGGGA